MVGLPGRRRIPSERAQFEIACKESFLASCFQTDHLKFDVSQAYWVGLA